MILLLETIHPDAHALLAAVGPVEVVTDLAAFDPADHPDVRAVVTRGLGRVSADVIGAFPDLAVVARCGAGLDNIDTAAAAAAGVTVVYAPGLTAAAVAEHALMLMLAVARRLPEVDSAVKSGNWAVVREGFTGTELRGKRLGIIGFGAIGSRIAALGRALGMDVVCTVRGTAAPDIERLELVDLLRTSDVVQICAPLTDATRGMIGVEQLEMMRPTAMLVNTARGPIVDHVALADALDAGELAGYGADVWDPEPPDVDDRVLRHPSTVITPHVAGLTDVTYRAICVRPAEAVVRILHGEQPDPMSVFTS